MTDADATMQTPPHDSRLARYLKLDRDTRPDGSHPAVQVVMQRPRGHGDGNRRLAEFIRIARGREA